MKVLLVHNYYKIAGGEDKVFEQEVELLRSKGHEVLTYLKDNKTGIRTIFDKFSLLFTTHYNQGEKKRMTKILSEFRPHIVHVHNFFPLFSPSIFEACQDAKIPVVLTLHNFRLLYPNGLLFNKSKMDLRTIKGSAYLTIKDRVYRNSFLQTFVVAHMIEYHKKQDTWNQLVNGFICLTKFSRDIYKEWGIDERKLHVKPNFIVKQQQEPPNTILDQFVCIGRLSEEKGVDFLVRAWMNANIKSKLVIIGDGELMKNLKEECNNHDQICFTGKLDNKTALNTLACSKALIFPSICYEGFPLVIVEAFALGIPVISSNFGNQGVIVEHEKNGLLFEKGVESDLICQVDRITQNPDFRQMLSENCTKDFETKYSEEKNYEMLMEIYDGLIQAN
ncbi:MAG: glycosyltransferase family 4 protein [Bacteroidetes bacterium]|nr:glycosyltransferase family 4 protein [Bacteroidota bacterium]MDA1119624.1 glycosyltransferase family 4 protein [Bacteroidota bacterium]